jgi:hypothetical protein
VRIWLGAVGADVVQEVIDHLKLFRGHIDLLSKDGGRYHAGIWRRFSGMRRQRSRRDGLSSPEASIVSVAHSVSEIIPTLEQPFIQLIVVSG